MPKAPVAIVDPYSAGALLAETLLERGVPCLAIESSPSIPAALKKGYNPDAFIDVIRADDNFERTLDLVRQHQPSHVIAGFESGVELAEQLADQLGLPANDPALREARRDKFLMCEAVKRHGLRTALQFRSSDVDEILDWTREMLDWPVIVKPPRSVGSDQVFCCQNSDEVRKAAVSILSDMNMLGASNTEAIVQEFLEGTEYVIDMVSVDAQPKLTAVWQYDRPKGAREFIAYDAMRLIPYDGQRQTALRDYASEVLKALGICFGPSHCEMIWREDGPVLVEIGARLTTGMNAVLSRICGGICHLDETVSAIMEPEMFLTTLDTQPELQQYAANVFLVPPHPGKLIRTRHLEDLRALPTLHSMSVATQRGDELKRVAGLLILIGSDPGAIDRDIEIIRSCERDGIFEVEEHGVRVPG